MAQNKKSISIIIIILYLILLVPYIIASNAGESGIVIESQKMDIKSLPNDMQDLLIYKNYSYNIILIEDPATNVNKLEGKIAKERKVVLSKETQEKGSFVRIDDITTDIFVTSYNLIDQPFEKLVIGDINKAGFGVVIETINNYIEQLNRLILSDVFSLSEIITVSKVDFYGGGLLVILVLTIFSRKVVALWNIPAIAAIYSFQIFLVVIVSFVNKIYVDETTLAFAFLFLLALPLAFWLQRYEETEDGTKKIYGLYLKNNEILSKIKHKFGM